MLGTGAEARGGAAVADGAAALADGPLAFKQVNCASGAIEEAEATGRDAVTLD